MARLVSVSFTPATAGGGVPRWNRDLMAAYPDGRGGSLVTHYSWSDVVRDRGGQDLVAPEWEKAKMLGTWLKATRKLRPDDVVVGDGFWADLAHVHPVERTLQVAHGVWSHLTKSDVLRGLQPDFPQHHEAQVSFRKRFAAAGGKSVAVSDFVAWNVREQWGLDYEVINNGIDLTKFKPPSEKPRLPSGKFLIVHGCPSGDVNKGWETIKYLERTLADKAYVVRLDDVKPTLLVNEKTLEVAPRTKYQLLSWAHLMVSPSACEGNSYFTLETLASDVPLVSYDVGLMHKVRQERGKLVGLVADRDFRSPEYFLGHVRMMLDGLRNGERFEPRNWVSQYSLPAFQRQWKEFISKEFGFDG